MAEAEVVMVRARAADAKALALSSKAAFDYDIHYGAPLMGGPPGYDSPDWQARTMRQGEYFKIVVKGAIAGGLIVFHQGVREYHLGRIFLAPEFQNQGIGTRVIELLWETYPLAKKWTLGTPAWNQRTQHFYKKVGFIQVGQDLYGGVLFERLTPRDHSGPM